MKLWIDDVRPMPKDYDILATNGVDAIHIIHGGKVTHVSFDHDIGEDVLTGYDIAVYVERGAYLKTIPPFTWDIHSDNPVGAARIKQAMTNADRYWKV